MPNISQITTNLEAMCQTYRKSLQIWKPYAKHIANHYKSGSHVPNISQNTWKSTQNTQHLNKSMPRGNPIHAARFAARKSNFCRAVCRAEIPKSSHFWTLFFHNLTNVSNKSPPSPNPCRAYAARKSNFCRAEIHFLPRGNPIFAARKSNPCRAEI